MKKDWQDNEVLVKWQDVGTMAEWYDTKGLSSQQDGITMRNNGRNGRMRKGYTNEEGLAEWHEHDENEQA